MTSLDLIGSLIIGGLVLLMILSFTFYFMNASRSAVIAEAQQTTAAELGRVIEHDFSKMGYRVMSGDKISSLSSNSISFRADLNNDSSVDSIRYYVQGSGSSKKLVRRVNDGNVKEYSLDIADFSVAAFDSVGNTTTNPQNVNQLQVQMRFSKEFRYTDKVDSLGAYWIRRFAPKNL